MIGYVTDETDARRIAQQLIDIFERVEGRHRIRADWNSFSSTTQTT
jgi:hypothetical protein